MESLMEKVNIHGVMVINILEIFKRELDKVKEFLKRLMDKFIMDNFIMIKKVVKEYKFIFLVKFLKENLYKIKDMKE